MKKKTIIITAVLTCALLIALTLALFSNLSPSQDESTGVIVSPDQASANFGAVTRFAESSFSGPAPADQSRSMIEFTGFSGSNSKTGTFSDWSAEIEFTDGVVSGLSGSAVTSSVSASNSQLENHLQADDFLNAQAHPSISFESSSLQDNTLTGDLTLLGVTQEITVPVNVFPDGVEGSFVLDSSLFGLGNERVNKGVQIEFVMRAS